MKKILLLLSCCFLASSAFGQLSLFTLVSPVDSSSIALSGAPTQSLQFTWNKPGGATGGFPTYTLEAHFNNGSFNPPSIALPSNNRGFDTTITVSYSSLAAVMNLQGIMPGDTACLNWRARCIDGSDTAYSVMNHKLTIYYGMLADSLSEFSLSSPNDSLSLILSGDPITSFALSWSKSSHTSLAPVSYQLLMDTLGGNFSAPLISVSSDNGGVDNSATFSFGQLSSALNAAGILVFDSAHFQWKVEATAAGLSRSSKEARNLFIQRNILLAYREVLDVPNFLYPNPSSGMVYLTNSVHEVSVYSLDGKKLFSSTTSGDNDLSLDLSALSPALYIVELKERGESRFQKLIIK